MNAILHLVVLVSLGSTAAACPASWVQGVGQRNRTNPSQELALLVSEEYLAARGVPPRSPAGEVILPYVLGTTIFDHESRIHRIDGRSVDQAVREAFDCPHHTEHYGDGKKAVEEGVEPVPTDVRGG